MSLRNCVLRAYHFHGGMADNEAVSAYVSDRRPESSEILHNPLIPREVQSLKNNGLLRNVIKSHRGQPGVWRLTQEGQQVALNLFGTIHQ